MISSSIPWTLSAYRYSSRPYKTSRDIIPTLITNADKAQLVRANAPRLKLSLEPGSINTEDHPGTTKTAGMGQLEGKTRRT